MRKFFKNIDDFPIAAVTLNIFASGVSWTLDLILAVKGFRKLATEVKSKNELKKHFVKKEVQITKRKIYHKK